MRIVLVIALYDIVLEIRGIQSKKAPTGRKPRALNARRESGGNKKD
jgi:hypothetical protein